MTKQRTDANINKMLEKWAQQHDNVMFLNPKDILCSNGICTLQEKHRPLFQDSGHLSVYGAEKIVPHIINLLH